MRDRIEPALTPERTADDDAQLLAAWVIRNWPHLEDAMRWPDVENDPRGHPAYLAAATIVARKGIKPDVEPREITREMVDEVLFAAQMAADVAKWCDAGWLGALAKQQAGDYRQQEARLLRVHDALKSYLPPDAGAGSG